MSDLATTDDTIYRGRLSLRQPAKGYRFGTDAMLLAASLQADNGQSVLELGCGVGAVLLAASSRLSQVSFTGIEREEAYAELAMFNAKANGLQAKVTIINDTIHDKTLFQRLGTFDHIVTNPPYFLSNGTLSDEPLRHKARHEEEGGIMQWLQTANRFLRPKGILTVIYPTDRLEEVLQAITRFAGGIRILPLWPMQGVPAKRFLLRATKGSRGPLRLLPGLLLHENNGTVAPEADHVINGGQALNWE